MFLGTNIRHLTNRGYRQLALDYKLNMFKKILKQIDGNVFFAGIHVSTQTMSCVSTHLTECTYPESEVRPGAPDVISVIRSICVNCVEEICGCIPIALSFGA